MTRVDIVRGSRRREQPDCEEIERRASGALTLLRRMLFVLARILNPQVHQPSYELRFYESHKVAKKLLRWLASARCPVEVPEGSFLMETHR